VPDEWFPGEGQSQDEKAFLAELRRLAGTDGLVDAHPEDTTLHVWDGALVVLVEPPGLRNCPLKPTLEVVVHLGPTMFLASGWETNGYLADACDPMDLEGVERSSRALARHTYDWFAEELRRPLERATWRSRWGGTFSLVRYADTGEPVWGHLSRRRRNRPPDEVVRLR
jgi:hypothetical protein